MRMQGLSTGKQYLEKGHSPDAPEGQDSTLTQAAHLP